MKSLNGESCARHSYGEITNSPTVYIVHIVEARNVLDDDRYHRGVCCQSLYHRLCYRVSLASQPTISIVQTANPAPTKRPLEDPETPASLISAKSFIRPIPKQTKLRIMTFCETFALDYSHRLRASSPRIAMSTIHRVVVIGRRYFGYFTLLPVLALLGYSVR